MPDELGFKTKVDIIDLIIGFLIEHERSMDRKLQQLERIIKTLYERGYQIEYGQASKYPIDL